MRCPRLDHFVRFNNNGTIGRCGHMIGAPDFASLEEMETSPWLDKIKTQMLNDEWPAECVRCEKTENLHQTSIRLNSIALDQKQTVKDYLIVGGVLDNVCNAACLTCNEALSTRIGALKDIPVRVDNSTAFSKLPQQRIVQLDLNGGEPSYSKNYRDILNNLPPNLTHLRINTNGTTVLKDLIYIAGCGIDVTVTLSCDGIGPVFEQVRWPITWNEFYRNLMIYRCLPVTVNLWTTVSCLNIDDLPNIVRFAQEQDLDHSFAYLEHPQELRVENKDKPESIAYIQEQKRIRNLL